MPGQASPRVLFVFSEVFAKGGIQRFNQTLLEASARLGMQRVVLSLSDAPHAAAPADPYLSVRGFGGNRLRFALAVARALLFDPFDRIVIGHINFLTLVMGVLTLRPARAARSILTAHGIEVWSGIGRMRRLALARTARVLCVSQYTRQRILEQAPRLVPARLTIFPNALAHTWQGSEDVVPAGRCGSRFILSVTRLERGDRYKGIVSVIEAFSMLADSCLHYVVVGKGPDLDFLVRVARRCGVHERVHFTQGVDDAGLTSLYRQCECFVLPSGKEGFGIVFLEAMYFGAPVIAAHEKGATDVVRDRETGLSVPFGDTLAIKRAIEEVIANGELREQLRRGGRSLVVNEGPFTFESFTRRCAEVLGVTDPQVA